MRVRSGVVVQLGLSVLVAACAPMPGATPVIGPDGSALFHVHCGGDQVTCFQLAGERCPSGYDLSPIFDPHDGNFLVRCHGLESEQLAAAPVAPAPVAPAPVPLRRASSSPPPVSDWPPAEVDTLIEPWPTPAASASASAEIGY